ncbi:MAG: WbuC family cupin fold metalloprotein [Bacteroidales bacterium]|nr:WbuC family cupin fold metalloprotein [Bacteroidales bacterium]
MFISQSLLSTLSSQAKSSPRLRQAYDLRNSENDNSQRMLNALEPGTGMPIHRHRKTSETVVIVRGSIIERFYDEDGNITEEVLMVPGGENPVLQVEKGRWHSLECLEPGTVFFEAKDGAWEPLGEEDIMR